MNDLSRNLLASAREGLSPSPDAAARVRARVAAAVGGAAAGTAATVPLKASAAATMTGTAGIGLGVKIGGATLLAVGVVVAIVVGRGGDTARAPSLGSASSEPEASLPRVSTSEHVSAPGASPAAGPVAAQPGPVVTQRGPLATQPGPVATQPGPVATQPGPVATQSAHSVSSPATLAREVELVDRAMLALRRGAAADALAAITIFDRETRGHGQLAEDAAAIAIEAHCALEDDVTARLAAFDRAYPSSAQRDRLRAACE